jgi:cytochrome c553
VQQQIATCVTCHPTSNVPANSVNPIIRWQNAAYVYLQLRDFKSATRASESDAAMPRVRGQTPAYRTRTISEFHDGKRGNSPGMADLLRAYSTDDVKAIVAYLRSAD